jgi:hypothetical protein
MVYTHILGVLLRSHRHVLLASAASLAALTGVLLVPAAASARSATTAATPAMTLAVSPATVDYGHQNVTASGTVTTSAGPVAGAAVTVSYLDVDGQSAQISLTTGTDGSYSGTIPDPQTAAQQVNASVAAASSTGAASASAPLGFTKDAVTITASFAQPDAVDGSTDMLSGVASYVSGGLSHPLANSTLSITSGSSPPVSAKVTTAADGSFSYAAPVNDGSGSTYTVSSAATAYLEAAQVSASADFIQVAQIDGFGGTISADRVLRFSVCAGVAAELANGALDGPLDYQYSTTPHGPWKTLGTGKLHWTISCGVDGGAYPAKFKAPLANAYYRAYAPAVPGALGQTSAVSQVINLYRYPTRITGLTITPHRVNRDGKVTVSGRLWQQAGTWLPDPGQQVVIEFRYKNRTYTLKHRLTTDSAGRFRGIFAVPHTAPWHALYNGSRNDFATASKAITIHVR